MSKTDVLEWFRLIVRRHAFMHTERQQDEMIGELVEVVEAEVENRASLDPSSRWQSITSAPKGFRYVLACVGCGDVRSDASCPKCDPERDPSPPQIASSQEHK